MYNCISAILCKSKWAWNSQSLFTKPTPNLELFKLQIIHSVHPFYLFLYLIITITVQDVQNLISSTSSFSKYPLQIISSNHRKTCSKLEKLFQVLSLACLICSNYCVILSQQQNQSCWSWWLWSKSTVLWCWWSLLIKMLTISVHISITAASS